MIYKIPELIHARHNFLVSPGLIHFSFMLIAFKPLQKIHEILRRGCILILHELILNKNPQRQQGQRTPLITVCQFLHGNLLILSRQGIQSIVIIRQAFLWIHSGNLLRQNRIHVIKDITSSIGHNPEHIPQHKFIIIPDQSLKSRIHHTFICLIDTALPQTGRIIHDLLQIVIGESIIPVNEIRKQRLIILLYIFPHLCLQAVTQFPVTTCLDIDILVTGIIEIP